MLTENRFKTITTFSELEQLVEEDKTINGMGAATANRYPIRFVLFDNFEDSYDFVMYLQQEHDVFIQSVGSWMEDDYPDLMITYQDLSERIAAFIESHQDQDCVITPFSELARFYDNDTSHTFDSLIMTLKAIEASKEGVARSQRIYIPIVGLEGKMSAFEHDTQINVWHLHREDASPVSYTMILTDDDTLYGMSGLDKKANVVRSMSEWLDFWKHTERHPLHTIISTSKCIYANAKFAQPDNAFAYIVPQNAYDFLRRGLGLDLKGLSYKPQEEEYWRLLAEQIDLSKKFDLCEFVCQYFDVNSLSSYKSFLKVWFAHSSAFDRWLLCAYFLACSDSDRYFVGCLSQVQGYSDAALFTEIALRMSVVQPEMVERRNCLNEAASHHVTLAENIEITLGKRLENIAKQSGYHEAIKHFTNITHKEKELAIIWLGRGLISAEEVKAFYPDLYNYMRPQPLLTTQTPWLTSYVDDYKRAKLGNTYTDNIKHVIETHNGGTVAFDTWYQSLKTVDTWLVGRTDIEVIYWIDGLGAEWIPYIKSIVEQHAHDNVYLNEVMIARALLPTTTEVNKKVLQKLSPVDLQTMKVGDLDALAHKQGNRYPLTLIEEMKIVRAAIERIMATYAGKKIAIVSDHGLTYLSQMQEGLGLAGFDSDHHGRVAVSTAGKATMDKNYIVLDDGVTVCALGHKSLCNKVPRDQGIHGGCTPEEVLVPIFVVSNNPNANHYSVVVLTPELSATEPIVRLRIKGLAKTAVPYILYRNKVYALSRVGDDEYVSARIEVDANESTMSVQVAGEEIGTISIHWNVGAQEEDLFDF